MNLNDFLSELKRRRVYKAAALYVIAALGIWQAADIAVPALDLPAAVLRYIVLGAIVCFPAVLLLAWLVDVQVVRGSADAVAGQPNLQIDNSQLRSSRTPFVVGVAIAAVVTLTLLLGAILFRRTGRDELPVREAQTPPVRLLSTSQTGRDSLRMVIRDPETFASAWRSATEGIETPPPLPTVDFSRKMVLLVQGPQANAEDRISVDSLIVGRRTAPDGRRFSALTVIVESTVGCGQPAVLRQTTTIVQAELFEGPIVWEERLAATC